MKPGLDIVSVGMVTAVGLDAPSSCAAMRARLDGFQETRFLGPGGEWLVGAPVPLPRNWIGEKRMAHLAAAAISEAFDPVPEARGDAALILCLAEEDRPGRPVPRPRPPCCADIAEIIELARPHPHPHRRPRPALGPRRARPGPQDSGRRARPTIVMICRRRQLPDLAAASRTTSPSAGCSAPTTPTASFPARPLRRSSALAPTRAPAAPVRARSRARTGLIYNGRRTCRYAATA